MVGVVAGGVGFSAHYLVYLELIDVWFVSALQGISGQKERPAGTTDRKRR